MIQAKEKTPETQDKDVLLKWGIDQYEKIAAEKCPECVMIFLKAFLDLTPEQQKRYIRMQKKC